MPFPKKKKTKKGGAGEGRGDLNPGSLMLDPEAAITRTNPQL